MWILVDQSDGVDLDHIDHLAYSVMLPLLLLGQTRHVETHRLTLEIHIVLGVTVDVRSSCTLHQLFVMVVDEERGVAALDVAAPAWRKPAAAWRDDEIPHPQRGEGDESKRTGRRARDEAHVDGVTIVRRWLAGRGGGGGGGGAGWGKAHGVDREMRKRRRAHARRLVVHRPLHRLPRPRERLKYVHPDHLAGGQSEVAGDGEAEGDGLCKLEPVGPEIN
mmetsp:Transcript_3434/g.7415  ORF Transcript_3434/g.7415 Transcript_3434/m.7415 type:complete len:220 (-) Transcript_3434:489-1148(-)